MHSKARSAFAPTAPQDGRNVDISNSLEIVYSVSADGSLEVDEAFLTKKMDQCVLLNPHTHPNPDPNPNFI